MKLEKEYTLSYYLHNDLFGRIFQSMAIYITFIVLLNVKGPDQTFSLILPVSTGLSVYYLSKDNNLKRSIGNKLSALSIVLSVILFIMIPPPKLNEWYTIFFLQGFREEMFFRFFMLGLLSKWIFPEKNLSIRTYLILILNSVLFYTVHAQYSNDLASLAVIFALSLVFSYFFIKMGIVTSIITHVIWNMYLPIRWPAMIFGLAVFIIFILNDRTPILERVSEFIKNKIFNHILV